MDSNTEGIVGKTTSASVPLAMAWEMRLTAPWLSTALPEVPTCTVFHPYVVACVFRQLPTVVNAG